MGHRSFRSARQGRRCAGQYRARVSTHGASGRQRGGLAHTVGLAVIVSLVIMVQTAATSRAFPTQDDPPNVDRDFLGVGLGSVLAGLFGAFAVNASPPRTAIVVESGGASQLSGLAAAAIVAATLFYGGSLLAQIPTAALAAVLIFVAGRLLRWRDMLSILRTTRAEFALVFSQCWPWSCCRFKRAWAWRSSCRFSTAFGRRPAPISSRWSAFRARRSGGLRAKRQRENACQD